MPDRNRIDDEITRLVRSVERRIPPELEARVRAAAAGSGGAIPKPARPSARSPALAAAVGAAAGALLLLWLLVPGTPPRKTPLISEIRTELEIPEKNIRVIFIQRPNFQLPKEDQQ